MDDNVEQCHTHTHTHIKMYQEHKVLKTAAHTERIYAKSKPAKGVERPSRFSCQVWNAHKNCFGASIFQSLKSQQHHFVSTFLMHTNGIFRLTFSRSLSISISFSARHFVHTHNIHTYSSFMQATEHTPLHKMHIYIACSLSLSQFQSCKVFILHLISVLNSFKMLLLLL